MNLRCIVLQFSTIRQRTIKLCKLDLNFQGNTLVRDPNYLLWKSGYTVYAYCGVEIQNKLVANTLVRRSGAARISQRILSKPTALGR